MNPQLLAEVLVQPAPAQQPHLPGAFGVEYVAILSDLPNGIFLSKESAIALGQRLLSLAAMSQAERNELSRAAQEVETFTARNEILAQIASKRTAPTPGPQDAPTDGMAAMAQQINALYGISAPRDSVTLAAALACGRLLLEARDRLPQEQGWDRWREENLNFEKRTASNYARIASEWERLEPLVQSGAISSIRQAVAFLKKV